jgi:endoglucanase
MRECLKLFIPAVMSKRSPAGNGISVALICGVVLSVYASAIERTTTDSAKPFPQHSHYAAGTIQPNHVSQAELDKFTVQCYDEWKKAYLVAGKKQGEFYVKSLGPDARGSQKTISVSEGQGYGMMITAFMAGHDPAAREIFDGLFRFCRSHPSMNNSRLMAWRQQKGEKSSKDRDSATDGDLDIAFALLLADAQWGSGGEINYRKEALENIAAIKLDEINRKAWTVKLGDWASPENTYYYATRLSDFMVGHFRTFRTATGDEAWTNVIDRCYSVIGMMQDNYSPSTGLLPDFVVASGDTYKPAPPDFLEGVNDGSYYYNSCRVPFRLGVDLIMTGDERARKALKKINSWIVAETRGDPSAIRAGYRLNGEVVDRDDRSQAFTACFAVGAMCDPSNQEWLNALWDSVEKADTKSEGYYGNTLRMLCMVALSGNWWEPPLPEGVR